jgi:hypothetical protein
MNKVVLSGALYVLIAFVPPIIQTLSGEGPLTWRTLTVMFLSGILAGANALKAFMSQSMENSKPIDAKIVNSPDERIPTNPTPPNP